MNDIINDIANNKYKWGFETKVATEFAKKGLNEDTIRFISERKNEPKWMLDFRLRAYHLWLNKKEPHWAHIKYPPIDYQDIIYWAAPATNADNSKKRACNTSDNADLTEQTATDTLVIANEQSKRYNQEIFEELKETYSKLNIPLDEAACTAESARVARDVIMDSVSVKTTFQDELAKHGIIFCPISEAIREYPELVQKHLGSVVSADDNFFAALNSAVFSDGSFVYIPKGVRCPMDLSTYFRINAKNTGQFERTLIIADEGSSVSYMEGCTAPMRDENQLHAAIVEIIVMKDAEVKYSTVQNWYPGDKNGKGGVYNFVTKRGICKGAHAKLSWTQVETGSAITWKYPSCILLGDGSSGEFFSVAVTNNFQQADTGTKMIHIGKNTHSTVISKGISAGKSQNSYRGLVKVQPNAEKARNYSKCDSLLLSDSCGAHTFPIVQGRNDSAIIEHEATTSKISEEQLFYCRQRGISPDVAVNLIVNGYAREVVSKLPMEFATEARKLLQISLDGTVG
ncbi:MAG: Fe-S cluster assembly protein SufB [Bacteroidales bacterium]|jgi:Fe-S cluster assembly protein SufB|nr:Fe-S cluster assembly protein SufB [Bacteroidales bacterium]